MKTRTAASGEAHARASGCPKEVVILPENCAELPLYLGPSLGKQLKYLTKTTCLKLAQLNSGDLGWLAINFCVFSN